MHQNRGSVLGLKNDHLDLQIRSPPFTLKINESQTSPPNFRSIGPQKKRDRTFDEIWAVKKNWVFLSNFKNSGSPILSLFSFYYLFLLPSMVAKKIGRKRRKVILLLTLLYKGIRGLKFWTLNLGLPHEKKSNNTTILIHN